MLHLSGFSDFFLNIASYGDEVERTLGARVNAKTLAPLSFTILNTIIYAYHNEDGPYHNDIIKLNPNYMGFRGALCENRTMRNSKISADSVNSIVNLVRNFKSISINA